jgi:hypothetical protein
MTAPLGARVDRRRATQRKRLVIGASVAAVIVVAGVAAALGGGGDDTSTKQASRSTRTTTTSSTTTTVPVVTTVVPKSTNPVVALAQQYDGYYEGTFSNTTFGSEGSATLELRIDPVAGTMHVTSDTDGDVFGGGAKELRQIKATIKLGDPNASTTTETKSFGQVTGHIDPSLAIVLTAADVPDPKVLSFELTGRLRADHSGFDATFHVVFEDQQTADGVLTVTCAANKQRPSEVTTLCAPPQ